MKLTAGEFDYLAICLEGFLFGELSVKPFSKEVQSCPMSGLYSGIFGLYLQYHASDKRTGNNTKSNIIFYALCVLYVLSVTVFALDIAIFWFGVFVSNNGHLFFFLTLH